MKRLMMSRQRLRAANTCSSGDTEYWKKYQNFFRNETKKQKEKELVAQSVMSATGTDTLQEMGCTCLPQILLRDRGVASALRIRMIANLDNRCLHTLITGIGNHPTPPPHMSGSGDNTSDDGVCSLARANAADLRRTDHVQLRKVKRLLLYTVWTMYQ